MGFVFWDTETTGKSTEFDQILQFAAIHTDVDLNELDRINVRCRLNPHIVPTAGAMRVTGVKLGQLIDPTLPSHYAMLRQIEAKLKSWSPAVFIGYNSLRFDEKLLRNALFRTLHKPYLTNTDGNARADALRLVQAASVYAPHCLDIPEDEDGNAVFKLDKVAPHNGFDHVNAHDALSDVLAVIHLARCISAKAPDLWSRFLKLATKASAAAFCDEEGAFVLTEFFFGKPYHYVVAPFGVDPNVDAYVLALDLRHDLNWVASLPVDQLATWMVRSPKPVRVIRTNATQNLCPLDEAPADIVPSFDASSYLAKAAWLSENEELKAKLAAAYALVAPQYEASPHVEEQLVSGGFIPDADYPLMEQFHEASWQERVVLAGQLADVRLRYHALRLIYEEHPQLLSQTQSAEIEAIASERLLLDKGPKDKWTSLPQALAEAEAMMTDCDEQLGAMLSELRDYLKQCLARYGAAETG